MCVKNLLKEFLVDCEIRKLSKRTIKSYKNNVNQALEFIEDKYNITNIQDINHNHIKVYIKALLDKKLSEVYLNTIIRCLRAYFKYCTKEEYININPMSKVQWIKEQKVIIKTFNDNEVINMLKAYKGYDYLSIRNSLIIAILFDTGIRCLELCTITTEDIKDNHILIKGKGNKERIVAISPYLQKYIIRYERVRETYFKSKRIPDNYLLSRTGRMLTVEAVERVVKECGNKADIRKDIRCSPHTCRHYFAQKSLRNGLNIYTLSRILGHENINITKRYLQSLEDENILEMSLNNSVLMSL